jgi:hypothetical protein
MPSAWPLFRTTPRSADPLAATDRTLSAIGRTALLGACVTALALGAGCTSRSDMRRGGGGGGGGGGTDGGPGGGRDMFVSMTDAACEAIDVRALPGTANVLVVLDRSSSMYREASTGIEGVDRWKGAVTALREVTATLDDRVNFGLMLFANPDAPAGSTLCGAGKVDVAPAAGTAGAIAAELTGDPNTLTGSWTPTAVSLDAARVALSSVEGRSYVLLVTDGAPNCNDALNASTCRYAGNIPNNPRLCVDDVRTVAAVEALAAAGIPTFVVGYETSEWADVLDRMAAAGGTAYPEHIEVSDGPSLTSALGDIAGSIVSCSYDLEEVPVIQYVQVTLDGADVQHESVSTGPGAWRLTGERTVELTGAACDTLRDGGTHSLRIVRQCYELF